MAEENDTGNRTEKPTPQRLKKARKDGWQRNLDEAIKARTKAKIAQIDIAPADC